MHSLESIIQDAKTVLKIESEQLLKVKEDIDSSFARAVIDILQAKGKCIITGMGKSGIIGRKIAASLSSTGTSSFFVHPGEAFHGDLGMFEKDDIVIMLSNSGETDEVLKLMSFFQYQGNKTISITSNENSTLAKNTTHHILCKVNEEACPLQLAPTSSTTAALAIGDAIVVSLMNLRQFQPENFARFHPGGSLGKRLLNTVKDLMDDVGLPLVEKSTPIKDVIHVISQAGYGLAILQENGAVIGVITDGDIRRAMEKFEEKFFQLVAEDIASLNPITIQVSEKALVIEELFQENSVNAIIAVNANGSPVGIVRRQ